MKSLGMKPDVQAVLTNASCGAPISLSTSLACSRVSEIVNVYISRPCSFHKVGLGKFPGIAAALDRVLEIMSGDLNRQRVGDRASGALLVFDPGGVWKGDPDWMIVDEKFNIDGIGVPCRYGNNKRLVQAMELLPTPAIGSVKVFVHST